MKKTSTTVHVLLHDIRSEENVGAMLRTCDAAGVTKVYFSGYTPTPIDMYGRERKKIAKSAIGAEKTMPYECVKSISPFIKKFQKKGTVVALEQHGKSIDFRDIKTHISSGGEVLVVVGNEVLGVDKKILEIVDVIAEIPMRGHKESLNVSVSLGILLYALCD